MTYLLTFQHQKDTYSILVKGREIFYSDYKLKKATRLVPVNPDLKRQVLMSRNKMSAQILKQFELTKEEMEEYKLCKTEEDMVRVCVKDALSCGSKLLKSDKIEDKDE